MQYQLVKELSSECLLMRSEQGEEVLFDKITFPVPLRESMRLEFQKELRAVVKQEENISAAGLIKYNNLEKYQGEIYLVRENIGLGGIEQIYPSDFGESCRVLLEILKIIKAYHQQGVVLGGLSPGMLKKSRNGVVLLQDPLVMNYLRKSLEYIYKVDPPPEVIRGSRWDEKSDLFSWGQLAYQVLTGIDPFLANSSEERIDKLVQAAVIPPRDLRPELSENISRLLVSILNKKPDKRLLLDNVITQFSGMIATGNYVIAESEARTYAAKAKRNCQRYQVREQFRWWFKKYGVVTLGTVLAVFIIYFSIAGSKPKSVITTLTKPTEVIAYYFKGVKDLDTILVDQSIYQAKNSFLDMVTNLYVINKTQQGMTYSMKDNIKVEITGLEVKNPVETPSGVNYQISYTLKVILPNETRYFERTDQFDLKPVRKIWRITGIKILKERQWQAKTAMANTGPPE
jgi:hypothetical protein